MTGSRGYRGWTPQVVDELTDEQLFWFPVMESARDMPSSNTGQVNATRVSPLWPPQKEVANEPYHVALLCPVGSLPSGYGTQTAIWIQKLTEMGHEVIVSSYWGLSGSADPVERDHGPAGVRARVLLRVPVEHCKAVQPDLVITLGDVWVLDPGLLRQMPVAHWLPSDCRPMSLADRAWWRRRGRS